METRSGGSGDALMSWGIAALVGFFAFVMLMMTGEWTFLQAAFVSAIVFAIVGAFNSWAFCRPLPGPYQMNLSRELVANPVIGSTIKMPYAKGPHAASVVVAQPVGAKPQMLDAPQGEPDNLMLIKGIGPKVEGKLNSMGVWHFSQIAGWTADEVVWVDSSLNFRGRIERDDWIGQAKLYAADITTEFVPRTDNA